VVAAPIFFGSNQTSYADALAAGFPAIVFLDPADRKFGPKLRRGGLFDLVGFISMPSRPILIWSFRAERGISAAFVDFKFGDSPLGSE
jgi:hypothetical protein